MKACITTLFLVLCQTLAIAQVNWTNEPVILKEIKGSIRGVTVKTLSGNISVIGTSAKPSIEVYVDAINESLSSKEDLMQLVKSDYSIDMTVKNHQLMVSASCKYGDANWKKALSISFRIFVPKDVTCNLTSNVGSISLAKLNGDQTFSTSGAVNLETINGIVKGQTSGGAVNVANCSPKVDVITTSGNISAVSCDGSIKLITGGGSLTLSRLKGTIEATTTLGNIEGDEVEGTFTTGTNGGDINLKRMTCHLKASTDSGTVTAQLSKACKSIKIDIKNGGANIQLASKDGFNLDLEGKSITGDMPKKFSGSNDGKKLSGAVYGGGAPVEVHAITGEVNLKFI